MNRVKRKSDEPIYLLVIEVNRGVIDLHAELPDPYDDLEEASAAAKAEHEKWGVGAVVFECRPAFSIEQAEKTDAEWEAQAVERLLADDALGIDFDDPVVAEIEALTAPQTYEVGPDELGPKRLVRVLADDPGWDGTDGAHPAWWRGNEAGGAGVVAALNSVLDSLEVGRPHGGHFAGDDLEALRRRLERLVLKETI